MTQQLIRQRETAQQWQDALYKFASAAHRKRQGILINYAYEPGESVPQRLYRYDVFEDYLSRHRDDFEFGFDLILSARHIDNRRTFRVYVIELDGNKNHVYVGQTWYAPEERLAQHLTGLAVFHAARPFKRGAWGDLRPDLYQHLPILKTQAEAEKLEWQWAMELRKAGFRVEGGH